jgi:hypothetical protein
VPLRRPGDQLGGAPLEGGHGLDVVLQVHVPEDSTESGAMVWFCPGYAMVDPPATGRDLLTQAAAESDVLGAQPVLATSAQVAVDRVGVVGEAGPARSNVRVLRCAGRRAAVARTATRPRP